jgi:hypothetical protein
MNSWPIVQILGVYKINVNSDVHLIELNINISPSDLCVSSFTQKDDNLSKDNWQTAYDEHFLNEDGTQVMGTSIEQDSLIGDKTRMAFFMYFIDFNKPLISQYGEFLLPEPSHIPERLSEIIIFETAD